MANCTSSQLKIQTDPPNAKVFMAVQEGKERKELGVTPLDINYRDLAQKVGTPGPGEYYVMSLEGKDMEADKILVPLTSFGARTVTIKVQMRPKQDLKTANVVLQRLHNAQKFAQSGELQSAHSEVDRALELDPQFVRSLSMKASLFYLQKNYQESIRWYEKALAVDSTFDEAVKMVAKIKREHK